MRSGSKEISKFEMKNISGAAKLIDHTLLKPGAGRAELTEAFHARPGDTGSTRSA